MKRKVLFLGCNFSQMSYLDVLKRQGWNIIGVDLNPNAPGRAICDSFYDVGYDDVLELIEIGKKEGFTSRDKVFTASAQFAHLSASIFADFFKIKYPQRESVELCLDKSKYYKFFLENGIPIPRTWYISKEDELRDIITAIGGSKGFYLKSDFSKNPKYVYRFNATAVPFDEIFWGRDRYLREYYILQEEFVGSSLRVNLYGDRFNVFDFYSGEKTVKHHDRLVSLGVIETLRRFARGQGLGDWLIKFDLVLAEREYAVLDIGLDPPSRMRNDAKNKEICFAERYIDQYLYGQITYPDTLDYE